jgi:hypothetical protein
MPLHSIVLIIHVIAVFVLCSVLCIEGLALVHLRAASTLSEAHPWIEPVRNLRSFAVGSVLAIQFSGLYLVFRTSSFDQVWPKVAMVALPALMAPFGNMTARRMRAIREAFRLRRANNSEMLSMLRAPFLKISLGLRIAAFLGIFLLVSVKPGLWGSVSLVRSCLAISLLASVVPWPRRKTVSNQSAKQGNRSHKMHKSSPTQ